MEMGSGRSLSWMSIVVLCFLCELVTWTQAQPRPNWLAVQQKNTDDVADAVDPFDGTSLALGRLHTAENLVSQRYATLYRLLFELTDRLQETERTYNTPLIKQQEQIVAKGRLNEVNKRSPYDGVSSVLPPWREFCRMLRMGNCWRYKRSTRDVTHVSGPADSSY